MIEFMGDNSHYRPRVRSITLYYLSYLISSFLPQTPQQKRKADGTPDGRGRKKKKQ